MTVTSPRPTTVTGSDARSRRLRRGVGVLAAVAAVLVVWVLGDLAGADYWITDSQGTVRIDLSIATEVTLILALAGWALLAVLERITRHGTRIWAGIAVLITVASEIPVFLVEATTATRVALFIVHLAVGAVLIPAYTRPAR